MADDHGNGGDLDGNIDGSSLSPECSAAATGSRTLLHQSPMSD